MFVHAWHISGNLPKSLDQEIPINQLQNLGKEVEKLGLKYKVSRIEG